MDGSLRTDVILSIVDVTVGKNPGIRVLEACLQILAWAHEREESKKIKKV